MIGVSTLIKRFTLCILLFIGFSSFAQTTILLDHIFNHTNVDGLLDPLDTDPNIFDSPRQLNGKYQVYFDGRKAYIQDESLLSGWPETTLMGWIKIDPSGNGNQFLFGQDNFHLKIETNGHLKVRANTYNLTNNFPLKTDQWIHVGASYSNTNQTLKLYINGEEVSTTENLDITLQADPTPFYLGRRHNASNPFYFKGHIDEVRLFNKALTTDEFQKIVYQEIENNGRVRGTEIPRDISTLTWSNLIKYYKLDNFQGDLTKNSAGSTNDSCAGARLYNITRIEPQTAPMPFITQRSGDLISALTIEADGVNGNDAAVYDWSIVKVEHTDVFFNKRQKHLGLFINEYDADANPIKYTVADDAELNVSWYLNLDGFIKLEGESQLVQGPDSMLDAASKGKIERDQQGTADAFTYNYWSSPVKRQNSNSASYRIMDVMKDGTDSNNPLAINFSSSGYDGAATSPIKIADYWIWKYANLPSNTYAAWQHIRRTGTVLPGEGFTMKGPGTGTIFTPQNYVFSGQPNNGDIHLPLAANNDYLVGNPYPSAIDAVKFIKDNGPNLDVVNSPNTDGTPLINGTLYFWDHWGGGSHVLQDYQGGYGTYNFSGAVAAAYKSNNHPGLVTGETPTKQPGQYIPVGQGFFVTGEGAGTIKFNNAQRVFKREGQVSQFMRNTDASSPQNSEDVEETDERMKFRIGFNSVNTIHRQLLLTIDENATPGIDWAYDGKLNDDQIDDMFWIINNEAFVIQASNEAEVTTTYPLGIITNTDGINSVKIDALENIPNTLDIYLYDGVLDLYHDLRTSAYDIFLNAGDYLDRFKITFATNESLGLDNPTLSPIDILYSNHIEKIVLTNPNHLEVTSVELFNMVGQSVYSMNTITSSAYAEYEIKNLSTGTYIIKLETSPGSILTKKVLVK